MTTVVEHLSQLICISSVSAISNRPVTDYAKSILTAQGWTTNEIPYADDSGIEKVNLIAAPPGQSATERKADLAFLCHTDTVPYARSWTRALEPHLVANHLHGCGACDVKGFLACLLTAAEQTTADWIHGLRIVLTADEEIGCLGTNRLIAMNAFHPRRIVIGEPTSLHVARAGKGYCLARVTIQGREAHSALPRQGVSAIYAAARAISAIEEFSHQLSTESHPLFEPAFTTLNIGTITGGSAKNVIPGHAEFLVEWRPIPGQSQDGVPAAIRVILDDLRLRYPGIHATLEMLRQQSGFETAAESPLVASLEKATGRAVTSIAFGSEASAWSVIAEEIVVFGPGDMNTAHSDRECVPVDELSVAVETVRSLMRQPYVD